MKITPIFPIVVLSLAPVAPAAAQLIPDNTLGRESSVVTPVGPTGDRIDGGAARGSNLFHSFGEFNVDAGRSVYFSNPQGIENIMTRVTGGNASNIFGILGVLGEANLFLVNPNGMLFGPDASLDIKGSFYGTTGEGIKLGENGLFSARDLDLSKLLQVRPSALFHNALAKHMATLNNQAHLAVSKGEHLVLHGGEVTNSGSLTAPGGTVMVLGDIIGLFNDARIDVSDSTGGGNVFIGTAATLSDRSLLRGGDNIPTAARTYIGPDVTISSDGLETGDGGNVIVRADEITGFYGQISARGGNNGGDGGFVELSGTESLVFRGSVETRAAAGNPGTLLLDPRNIAIANGSPLLEIEDAERIASEIFKGVVGETEDATIYESQLEALSGQTNVILQATNDLIVADLADDVLSFSPGRGKITLTADADGDGAGSFVMEGADSAQINYIPFFSPVDVLFANGADTIRTNGRDLAISGATLRVGNIDASGMDNDLAPSGNGGKIALEATHGDLKAANLSVSTLSRSSDAGEGGTITLNASGNMQLENLTSGSQTSFGNAGKGGEIALSAGGEIATETISSLSISLSTAFVGTASDGGDISILAGGDITTGFISSLSNSILGNTGNGGAISLRAGGDITTPNVILSLSFTDSGTAGSGGAIALRAGGDITTQQSIWSWSGSKTGTAGSGGEISIEASGAIAFGASDIDESAIDSTGDGGGDITITSQNQNVSIINAFLNSNANGSGNSGQIKIAGANVNLENTDLNTALFGKGGVGGNIAITASEAVKLDLSRLFSGVEPEAIGDGGNIEITARLVDLSNASSIDTATFGEGNAGDVRIGSAEMFLDRSGIFSITNGQGNGGNVTIEIAETLLVASGSNISTAVDRRAAGDSGKIEISAGSLSMTGGSQLQALTRGRGASGDITINVTEDIQISGIDSNNGLVSGVFTSTDGENSLRGGQINVTAANGNLLIADGAVLSAESNSPEPGGDITVRASRVELSHGGQLLTNSFGRGAAGNIIIDATQGALVTGVDSNFNQRPTFSTPPRQNVVQRPPRTLSEAQARQLLDADFSLDSIERNNPNVELSARIPYVSIEGTGDGSVDTYRFEVTAGTRAIFDIDNGDTRNNLPSDVRTRITLFNERGEELASNSFARATLGAQGSLSRGEGNPFSSDPYIRYAFSEPGIYFIEVGALSRDENFNAISVGISPGSTYELQVSLETPNVTGSVVETIPQSDMFARASGAGAAGNITVNAPQLTVSDGAGISATTTQTASTSERGGSISINASRLDLSRTANSGSIEAQTLSASPAGQINLQPLDNDPTLTVNLENDFEISASTAGEGAGGNLNITAPSSVILTGKGRMSVESRGAGAGGNVRIYTGSLRLTEGARVSASSSRQSLGDIASIGEAGELNVTADSIELDNGFLEARTAAGARGNINITTADLRLLNDSAITTNATGTATGGNITISTDLLVAKAGSAISANAVLGAGGNIRISSKGVFLDNTSQITATSDRGIDGTVEINSSTERASGVVELDNNPLDAEKIIAQNFCVLAKENNSSFIITGRGGIAINPGDYLTGEGTRVRLIDPVTGENSSTFSSQSRGGQETGNSEIADDEIRQAQGWVQLPDGTVVLTSYPVISTPYGPLLQHPGCSTVSSDRSITVEE